MTLLWILLGILVLLFLLSMLSAHVVLEYRESVSLTLSVLFLNFRLFPKKKKKIRLSDYSKKAIEKRKRREKRLAKKQKPKKQASKSENKAEEKGIVERLGQIRDILIALLGKTFGHLSVSATRIRILVATGDAASTAILFGAVNGAVVFLMEALDHFGSLKNKPKDELEIRPDYLAEKTTVDIRFVFSLRVWHILDILLQTFFTYIKSKKQKTKP